MYIIIHFIIYLHGVSIYKGKSSLSEHRQNTV